MAWELRCWAPALRVVLLHSSAARKRTRKGKGKKKRRGVGEEEETTTTTKARKPATKLSPSPFSLRPPRQVLPRSRRGPRHHLRGPSHLCPGNHPNPLGLRGARRGAQDPNPGRRDDARRKEARDAASLSFNGNADPEQAERAVVAVRFRVPGQAGDPACLPGRVRGADCCGGHGGVDEVRGRGWKRGRVFFFFFSFLNLSRFFFFFPLTFSSFPFSFQISLKTKKKPSLSTQGPGPHRLPLRRGPPRPHQPVPPPPPQGRRRFQLAAQDRARPVLQAHPGAEERVQGLSGLSRRRGDAGLLQRRRRGARKEAEEGRLR